MTIIVDGDACPVKNEIIALARTHACQVLLVASLAHDMPEGPGIEVLRVDAEPEAADIAIMNRTREGDIVITADYGLACMVLGRKARVIDHRGGRFTDQNIDGLMARRHANRQARRAGHRTKGPRPFLSADREAFTATLERLLIER